MNINPAALHALADPTTSPRSAATPSSALATPTALAAASLPAATPQRPKDARKQDEISPSPLRVFTPPPPNGTSTPGTTTTTSGLFVFGDKRDQGPTTKPCSAGIDVQEITRFFSRKSKSSCNPPPSPVKLIQGVTTTPPCIVDHGGATPNLPGNDTVTIADPTGNSDPSSTIPAVAPTDMTDGPGSPPTTSRTSSAITLDSDDFSLLSNVKLVPLRKTAYKPTPAKTKKSASAVAFSPTNEVRVLESTEPANCVSVTKDATLQPTPPTPHVNKTIFEISVRISPNTNQVQTELSVKLLKTLAFIQQWIDPSAAFLPKSESIQAPPITDKTSYPLVIYILASAFFSFNTGNWYTRSQDRGKQVRLSATIGLNKDPSDLELARAETSTHLVSPCTSNPTKQ